jgi:hypothetical protein
MLQDEFLSKLKSTPNSVEFQDTMAVIDALYNYKPVAFVNGDINNSLGENEGSCKIFAFAKMHGLTEDQTLACFGSYYRDDVLNNPSSDNHQNIRNFMKTGWKGIKFDGKVLTLK